MLKHRGRNLPLTMTPEGSLNSLVISEQSLHTQDPFSLSLPATGFDLASRQAFIKLLTQLEHPSGDKLRHFIEHFDPDNPADWLVCQIFAHRFSSIIKTAQSNIQWQEGTSFQQALSKQWLSAEAIALSGGLTSHQFGVSLAEQVEQHIPELSIISSPFGGLTALYGLAETAARPDDILVFDFGSTGIKRCIAHSYGNHIDLLPELSVAQLKDNGLMRARGVKVALADTAQIVGRKLPVAISMAVYLKNGHPFNYHTGTYNRLIDDTNNLAQEIDQRWLPEVGFGDLLMLEHDSTAAALAFQFKHPAMMVTLGTGLGSAPCQQEA